MTRPPKPNTPTTCAAPDCSKPRQWDKRRQRYISRFCTQHALERRAAKKAAAVPARPMTYAPADVLAAWDAPNGCAEFTYRGQHVYGLAEMQEGTFLMVLAGVNDPLVIPADAPLRRVEKS